MIGAVNKFRAQMLEELVIDSLPDAVCYVIGDTLDLTGLVVKARFNTGDVVIDDYTSTPNNGAVLTSDDVLLEISYESLSVNIPLILVEQATGYSYGFERCNNNTESKMFGDLTVFDKSWFRSTNKGLHSTSAGSLVHFYCPEETNVYVDVLDVDNESSYDYGTLGALDGEILGVSTNYSNTKTALVEWSGNNNHVIGGETIVYSSVSEGEHTIYTRYKKDSSSSGAIDRLYFRVRVGGES